MDLSIIIVSYNTKEILNKCLKSVYESLKGSKLKYEVIVVDNNSQDGSVELVEKYFTEVILLKNKENQGYAKANNQGIIISQGKYVLLLNSDTIVINKSIEKMVRFLDKTPTAGVVTPKVELPNGKIDPACHRGFPTPWASITYFLKLEKCFPKIRFFSGYHLWYKNLLKIHEIDACSGAFFLIKKEVLKDVGMLDEDYFMYGEDLDWCYRIKEKNWKIYYNPESKIIHLKKRSGFENPNEKIKKRTNKFFYNTMEIFYKKHYEKKYPAIVTKLVMLGIKLKSRIK